MREPKRDSAWSWLVLFCAVCCQIVLGGICLSGGLFFIVFTNAFGADPVEISWLCSLPITMWFISSPIGSVLTNRYGYRVCSFVGGILAAGGLSLSYFATSPTFLFLSYGFLAGLGLGINFTGCMSALNVYFDKYRTLAAGIASIGNNLGLIIFADLIVSLDEYFGWRGMFLIIGGISLNLCACAIVMFPIDVSLDRDNTHRFPEEMKKAVRKKTINLALFRKLSFLFFCTSNVFVNFSFGSYILHLPTYSKDAGFNKSDFATVLMVSGLCNIVGKLLFSFSVNQPGVNVNIVYTISLTITGISMGLTPVFLSRTGMLVLAGLVGCFYSVTWALINAVINKIVGLNRFTDGVGLSLPFKATGNIIGGPIAGVLLTITGSYAFSFYLAGVSMFLSSCLLLHPIVHIWRREKNYETKNIHLDNEMDLEVFRKGTFDDPDISVREHESETMLNVDSNLIDTESRERTYAVIQDEDK